MNKTMVLFLFAVLLAVGTVAAEPGTAPATITVVSGNITGPDGNSLPGAHVEIDCDGTVKTTTSMEDGIYYETFDVSECPLGAQVHVVATYETMEGGNDGVVTADLCVVNAAIVDVQIPEFGVIAGSVALIGGVAGFLFLRRRND